MGIGVIRLDFMIKNRTRGMGWDGLWWDGMDWLGWSAEIRLAIKALSSFIYNIKILHQ